MIKPLRVIFHLFLLFLIVLNAGHAQELTDPTRPAVFIGGSSVQYEQKKQDSYKVSQIYTGSRKKTAVINGRKVMEGDWIDNAQIVAIHSTSISLLVDGTLKKIYIIPSFKTYKK